MELKNEMQRPNSHEQPHGRREAGHERALGSSGRI